MAKSRSGFGSGKMGGRGGSRSISNEKPVSKLMAKVYYNAAAKSDALRSDGTVKKDSILEKIIKSENTDYFMQLRQKRKL